MPRYEEYDQSMHQAALILGDPVARAYEWIRAYAENLSAQTVGDNYGGDREVTVKQLMDAADSHQGEGWGDYIIRGGTFEGESIDPTFWEKYAIFREIPLEDLNQSSLLSCSC